MSKQSRPLLSCLNKHQQRRKPVVTKTTATPSQLRAKTNRGIYKGWDVHAYTRDFRTQLKLLSLFMRRIDRAHMQVIMQRIMADMHQRDARCDVALRKIRARYQDARQGYFDAQLNQINIILLLDALYRQLLKNNDDSLWQAFIECLVDTGNTCTQGDSHRLAALYIALMRSLEKA